MVDKIFLKKKKNLLNYEVFPKVVKTLVKNLFPKTVKTSKIYQTVNNIQPCFVLLFFNRKFYLNHQKFRFKYGRFFLSKIMVEKKNKIWQLCLIWTFLRLEGGIMHPVEKVGQEIIPCIPPCLLEIEYTVEYLSSANLYFTIARSIFVLCNHCHFGYFFFCQSWRRWGVFESWHHLLFLLKRLYIWFVTFFFCHNARMNIGTYKWK